LVKDPERLASWKPTIQGSKKGRLQFNNKARKIDTGRQEEFIRAKGSLSRDARAERKKTRGNKYHNEIRKERKKET